MPNQHRFTGKVHTKTRVMTREHVLRIKLNAPEPAHDLTTLKQFISAYETERVASLQTLEQLTEIPGFIPDRIFPFLTGRDQLQLAHTSPILFKDLVEHLPPKVICSRCLNTIISNTGIPDHVKFMLSASQFSSTVAITMSKEVTNSPLDSEEMAWAREKVYVGEQQHKGTPVLHCKRCRNIVAIVVTRSVHDSSIDSHQWKRSMSHLKLEDYKVAQIIVALKSGTKYIAP